MNEARLVLCGPADGEVIGRWEEAIGAKAIVIPMPELDGGGEAERLFAMAESAARGGGSVLLVNLLYPLLRPETARAAFADRPCIGVSEEKAPVHSFFAFRREGLGAAPPGKVSVARTLEGFPTITEWGTLTTASGADAYGHFEIMGKWRFDDRTRQWYNTEGGERQIAGRQDVPTVYRIRDALAAGTAGEIARIGDLLSRGRLRGIRLAPAECLRAPSPVALLRPQPREVRT